MPQYRDGTQKASCNADTLAAYVKSIQDGKKSILQAARYYGIPYSTLHDRLKSAFNKDEVKHFYGNLEGLMAKYKFSPDKISTVDETGINTVQNPGQILAKKVEKRAGTTVSWERGRNVIAVCAMSASGSFTPPMFICPRQRLSKIMKRDGPPSSSYQCSKSGWINEELF
ncbi:hypothetical protein PR048_010888 [Dryococelus australis]|uniref:HTH psq-type domain-containing protein n=1 Tax=Dryococelus australis TaxID=614101 RepID=A0ABQ9I410_9NEOP|nr:hypothetical protein PR048_010888 [Dryococelus australis]